MERDEMQVILEVVEERLSGLDQITRREVLKALLKSSAFLALLTGGGGALVPALAGAAERKFLSAEALTAPAPDRQFKHFRIELVEGTRAMLDQFIQDTLIDLGYGPGGLSLPTGKGIMEGIIAGGAPGCADEAFVCEGFNCPSINNCSELDCGGSNTCQTQGCGPVGLSCSGTDVCSDQWGPGFCIPVNICNGETCPNHVCDPVDICTDQANPGGNCTGGVNSCNDERCSGLACMNVCTDQQCPGNTCNPASANVCDRQTRLTEMPWKGFMDPREFVTRYGNEPFVRELKDLFGQNLLEEIAGMIRARTTLRGRGLVDPGAPPPPSTPTLDTLRDLPGARMPQPLGQPGVQPPTAPTAPTAPPTAPAAPPTVTPTAPPPAAPPVHKPPVVAPTPVTPPPVVPTPVVPAPVTPIAPTPITPPKPIP
jgi:hypothetical protein